MSVRENGPTLEGLAQRLEALERENAELRNEVVALRGSDTRWNGPAETRSLVRRRDREQTSRFEGPLSRRALLGKAGAAAVAAMAAGILLNPREARAENDYFDVIYARKILAGDGDTLSTVSATNTHGAEALWGQTSSGSLAAVYGENQDSGPAVEGVSNFTGAGVEGTGKGNSGYGARGTGFYGVWGESDRAGGYGVTGRNTNTDGTGVRGVTNNSDGRTGVRGEGATGVWGSSSKTGYSGVYGQHTGSSGYGLVGDGKGGSAGVLGRNSGGEGVRGEGSTTAEVAGVRGLGTTGVWGSSSRTGYSGLYGQHTGSAGYGVVGDGRGATGSGVIGRNPKGPGIEGRDSRYGGKFAGSRAQLMIKPKGGTAGKPTTGAHAKGEISMDSAATLWVCVASGTPGTWRKVATTAN